MKTYNGVLWYRDYWPNRYGKLECRRKLARIPEMVKKSSKINKNLTVQQGRDNRCILKNDNTTYDLLNPTDLISKFEPWSMKPLSDSEWIPEMPYSKLSLQRNRKLKIQLIFTLTVAVASSVYYFYSGNPVSLLGNGILVLLVWLGLSAIPVETRLWIYFYDGDRSTHFFDVKNTPPWLTKKRYYVFRFLYKFQFEWTFDRYQLIRSLKTKSISFDSIMKIPDWERVELWVGAEDGIVEWIVSDYHYKELWYHYGKTETPICVKFHDNFHTPEPILGVDNIIKNGLKVGFGTDWEEYKDTMKKYHKSMKYGEFFSKIDQAILFKGFMNSLPWKYIRYPYGADSNVYTNNSLGAHEMVVVET